MSGRIIISIFSAHYERGSMIITSNREFIHWVEVFHNEQMTAASLNRVTHKAHFIPMNGESYRLKETYSK
jgi:DNA replication protein DnaC